MVLENVDMVLELFGFGVVEWWSCVVVVFVYVGFEDCGDYCFVELLGG